jgi:hypothetical protein
MLQNLVLSATITIQFEAAAANVTLPATSIFLTNLRAWSTLCAVCWCNTSAEADKDGVGPPAVAEAIMSSGISYNFITYALQNMTDDVS